MRVCQEDQDAVFCAGGGIDGLTRGVEGLRESERW